jgi:pimeloyl-ACP methyl ester carboxylesterase
VSHDKAAATFEDVCSPEPFERIAPEKIAQAMAQRIEGWPMLEVIDKGQSSAAHPTALLFVHGGYHAAWCWDEHFLDYFADNGFRALAVSLRGHGGSTRSKPLGSCSISDYVDDTRSAADRLDSEPVLVGHSMGGFVVQKYLETYRAPATVLMASMPPQGVL